MGDFVDPPRIDIDKWANCHPRQLAGITHNVTGLGHNNETGGVLLIEERAYAALIGVFRYVPEQKGTDA